MECRVVVILWERYFLGARQVPLLGLKRLEMGVRR